MKKSILIFITTILIMLFTVIPSTALRCGCGLVSIGDPIFLVLKKCGEPIYKELIRYGIKEPKTNTLVYEIGGRYYYLTFKDGKLFEIESFMKR